MSSPVPLIVVWVLLGLALIAYVVYRFITDRVDGSKRHHPLYPMISSRSDPTAPSDRLSRLGYAVTALSMLGFVIVLVTHSSSVAVANAVLVVSAAGVTLGLALSAFASIRRRRSQ
jgi:hypothetical protein